MSANHAIHAASMMARVLRVSESGFYAWKARPPRRKASEDSRLIPRIRAIHDMSNGTYGTPSVGAELIDVDGLCIGIGHVARLMRRARTAGAARRRFCTIPRPGGSPASQDLVDREFKPKGPNKLWVADITYIPTWAGVLTCPSVAFTPPSSNVAE